MIKALAKSIIKRSYIRKRLKDAEKGSQKDQKQTEQRGPGGGWPQPLCTRTGGQSTEKGPNSHSLFYLDIK